MQAETIQVAVDLVQAIGFPAFVTIFLLLRFETSLKRIETALVKMCERMERK